MSMKGLSTFPAAGCVRLAGRGAYPFSAPLCGEITTCPYFAENPIAGSVFA